MFNFTCSVLFFIIAAAIFAWRHSTYIIDVFTIFINVRVRYVHRTSVQQTKEEGKKQIGILYVCMMCEFLILDS